MSVGPFDIARSLRARSRLPRIRTRPETISRVGLVPAAIPARPPVSLWTG